MKIPTLYLDTSVIGGYYDAEWIQDTRELWRQAQEGKWKLVTSVITERELLAAPLPVRTLFEETFPSADVLLPESDEPDDLTRILEGRSGLRALRRRCDARCDLHGASH